MRRRMQPCTVCVALVGAVVAVGGSMRGAALADELGIGGMTLAGVKIIGMEEGRVRYRLSDGRRDVVAVEEVELLVVDRGGAFVDFNQAERMLAAGEPVKAIARYRRFARASEDFWSDLVVARLLMAADRAGDLERATSGFIRVMRGRHTGVACAARMIPLSISTRRDSKMIRSVDRLSGALTKTADAGEQVLMSLFQFAILHQCEDQRTSQAARRVIQLPVPAEARTPAVYTIMLLALETALAEGASPEALGGVERAIADCPDEVLADFLLLKGRTLAATASTREDMIRASWPFMRAVAHMPDDAEAAEGLYETALMMERLGRGDRAIDLLNECLAHERITDETRGKAATALKRMQSEPAQE